jgi:hypothetical protein
MAQQTPTTRPPVYSTTADSFEVVNPVWEERKKTIKAVVVGIVTAIAVYFILKKIKK